MALGWLGAALLYGALGLLLCLPILTELGTHVPLGELGEPTVPFFNLWTLLWNADRLRHGFADYWNAPIFHPAPVAFALSEPQGLTGLWFAPLAALAGPLAAYNLTLLSLLVANGLAGRRLLRELDVPAVFATLGGMLFVGLQFLREELGVLQLCATWPVVLGLAEVARLTRRADPWAVVRLGLWIVASGWSCIYYLMFFCLIVALAAPFVWRRGLLERRMLSALLAGSLIVAAGILPLLAAERRAVASHTRSAASIHTGSGSGLAYAQFPRDTPLAKLFPGWARAAGRRSLYPGALMCALALLGGLRARRGELQRFLWYSCAALLLALLLSFGTRLHVAGFTPYELTAQRYLPGFDQLRSPYRGAAFVQLLVACWAGVGLCALPRLAAVGCVLLALFEVTPWHFPRAPFPYAALREPWIAWLARQPEGAVAMLPPNKSGKAADYVDTTVYMLQSLEHRHPIVNGYSGFFPPAADRMVDALRLFPDARSVDAMRRANVRYAVVARELGPAPGLVPVFSDAARIVYRVQ